MEFHETIENDTSKIVVFPNLRKSQPDSIHLRINPLSCCNDLDPLRGETEVKRQRKERRRKGKEEDEEKNKEKRLDISIFILL